MSFLRFKSKRQTRPQIKYMLVITPVVLMGTLTGGEAQAAGSKDGLSQSRIGMAPVGREAAHGRAGGEHSQGVHVATRRGHVRRHEAGSGGVDLRESGADQEHSLQGLGC